MSVIETIKRDLCSVSLDRRHIKLQGVDCVTASDFILSCHSEWDLFFLFCHTTKRSLLLSTKFADDKYYK